MAVALSKGESLDLSSGAAGKITKVRMGVGWDPVRSGNILWRIFFQSQLIWMHLVSSLTKIKSS